MRREVWHELNDTLLRVDNAEPQCGEDFCDVCGDCLHCYETDACGGTSGKKHRWVSYVKVEEAK